MTDSGPSDIATAGQADPVLAACLALQALAADIDARRHAEVAPGVERLSAELQCLAAAQRADGRLVLNDAQRAAIRLALDASELAFARSIRACVITELATPLTTNKDMVFA